MVIVVKKGAPEQAIADMVRQVESVGGQAFVSRGAERTIIGLIGDPDLFSGLGFRANAWVENVVRISSKHKLVSREHHQSLSQVRVGQAVFGGGHTTLIAGPCAVETYEQTLAAALMAKAAGAHMLRGGAYKPRTSPYAFQGLGRQGLEILAQAGAQAGLPTVTEVITPHDVELVTAHVDMLQVGARNMQNFALLQAVGESGKPVLLKRGLSATIDEWLMAAEYIAQRGSLNIVLCERGIRTYETRTRNTLDISAVPVLRQASHLPVIVDPSHSGGDRSLVLPLARAALAAGADGLIVDVHATPHTALCDGPQALRPEDMDALRHTVTHISQALGRLRDLGAAPDIEARVEVRQTVG
jgi:3-deoxy-7-phosphoheptulonate synthase